MESVTSDAERRILEKAIAAQAQYAVAPKGFVAENTSDEYLELVKTFAPEALDVRGPRGEMLKKSEWHAYFSDKREVEMYATRAYRPVINNGEFVRGPGGEVLMLCPRSLFDAKQHQSELEHAAIVARDETETGWQSTAAQGATAKERRGELVDPSGVQIESETLTPEQF